MININEKSLTYKIVPAYFYLAEYIDSFKAIVSPKTSMKNIINELSKYYNYQEPFERHYTLVRSASRRNDPPIWNAFEEGSKLEDFLIKDNYAAFIISDNKELRKGIYFVKKENDLIQGKMINSIVTRKIPETKFLGSPCRNICYVHYPSNKNIFYNNAKMKLLELNKDNLLYFILDKKIKNKYNISINSIFGK